ncbi:hypothetical protein V1499_02585 [Neobacillus sp. SCS-31]|uniref:hypothetical protein n=1 Tax=Neobacillus oceani TaxID=3115292 RepID=UPI00390620CF
MRMYKNTWHPFLFFLIRVILINNKFSNMSILLLVPVRVRKDQKHYIVENIETGDFYEMPEICVTALECFSNGLTIKQTEEELAKVYQNEAASIYEFVEQLLDYNLIKSIDGHELVFNQERKKEAGFKWIPERLGKFFFHKSMKWFYWIIFIGCLFLMGLYPYLLPNFKDIFVFNTITLSMLFWIGITFTTILFHEFGHILALRANNLPAKLGIGHRLFIVVFETDMSAAWALNPHSRNFLFLSGLCFDTVVLFSGLSLQLVVSEGTFFSAVLRLLVLDCILRMVYQCGVYMKTDLYYVIENKTGVYNLMESTNTLIKEKLGFKRKERSNSESPEGRSFIRIYAVFYIFGITATLAMFVLFYIPQLLYALKIVIPGFNSPISSPAFWDAFIFTMQLSIGLSLLLYSWNKKYRLKKE